MPRNARIVVPNFAHHVTQRGNKKQRVFYSDSDREFFLEKLSKYSKLAELEIISYCLMDNHTHLVVVPKDFKSLSKTFKPLHMNYSQRLNKKSRTVGRNWQGRFFSSPMDMNYTFNTIKYLCLNPVKANMVINPEDYKWSSAKAHLYNEIDPILTASSEWLNLAHLAMKELNENNDYTENIGIVIERNTMMNLPLGSDGFIKKLEGMFSRSLRYRGRGRPKKGNVPFKDQ